MNLKTKVLGAGVLFFLGGGIALAQTDSTRVAEVDEVVIVGYTAVKKEDYTGSVSKVGSENISKKNVSNVAQAYRRSSWGTGYYNLWSARFRAADQD
ncbi:hypothetical protein LDL59_15395 [Kaistella anthropi]|nr:hypothetical protein [Kaistella anthropi]